MTLWRPESSPSVLSVVDALPGVPPISALPGVSTGSNVERIMPQGNQSALTRKDIHDVVRHELASFATTQLREELRSMAYLMIQEGDRREPSFEKCETINSTSSLRWASNSGTAPLAVQVSSPSAKSFFVGRVALDHVGESEETTHDDANMVSLATLTASPSTVLPGAISEEFSSVPRPPKRLFTPDLSGPTQLPQILHSNQASTPDSSVCGDVCGDVAPNTSLSTRSVRRHSIVKVLPTAHKRKGNLNSVYRVQLARRNSWSEYSSQRIMVLDIVNSERFDMVCAGAILLNGIIVGIQTDYLARNMTDETPTIFEVIEVLFCLVFTVEIGMRLFAYRYVFFMTSGALAWNLFDLLVVILQLIDIILSAISRQSLGDLSFTLLRTLRLIRVVRLARTLRLIGELRTIVSSIAGSMKPLFWTGVLLFMIIYVVAVYITQMVCHKRIEYRDEGKPEPEELLLYWRHLAWSMYSLFQSIAGGIDWHDVNRPLIEHVGDYFGPLYSLYILFTVFAMLNVVSGVFIQSVINSAKNEHEFKTKYQVQKLFETLDVQETGDITWAEFEEQLERTEMQQFFNTINVDIEHARNLFNLLDMDGSGAINANEFIEGCLRIWAPSQGLDRLMIQRELTRVRNAVDSLCLDHITKSHAPASLSRSTTPVSCS